MTTTDSQTTPLPNICQETFMTSLRRLPTHLSLGALGALCALGAHTSASAAFVRVPDSGPPLATCNPKPFRPNLKTCRVEGLPGSAAVPGYILKASATRNITVNGVVIGAAYDRVYCKGTGTSCDSTNNYILALRVRMSDVANFPARNPHCPMWTGASNECFEINNFFRQIRGSNPVYPPGSDEPSKNAVERKTEIAYFMGTTAGSSDPDIARAFKYLEYSGKTFKGLEQYIPPGNGDYTNNPVTPGDRDATRITFQADTNVFDPDGASSQWSPWLLVRQTCDKVPAYSEPVFALKYWQGGEEGQIQQNIQAKGYACTN